MYNANFFIQVFLQGLAFGGVYALLAMGMTLIYAVSRTMHVTHGNFLAVAMYVCFLLATFFHLDPYLSVFITAPLFFGIGIALYLYFYGPLQKSEMLIPIQAFIALVFIIQGGLYMIFGGNIVQVPSSIQLSSLHLGSYRVSLALLVAGIVAIVSAAALYWMLKRTDLGHQIRAIAQKRDAAILSGINVRKVEMMVFGCAFVLIAVAASFVSPFWSASPGMGLEFTMFAFIVLVVGGMGNFLGALMAGFLIGIAEAFSQYLLGSNLGSAIPYVVFVLVLFFRPKGLMGTV